MDISTRNEDHKLIEDECIVPWWAVSASLFASNIGTEHFIGTSI